MRSVLFAILLPLGVHAAEPAMLPVHIENATGVHRLRVEIAATPAHRARGLMARDTLAADTGMLFLYPRLQPGSAGFWMYNTRIPLDIAFLDSDGRIRAIRTMSPCPPMQGTRCPSYRPHVEYAAALEVNGGYLALHGIHIGDRVVFDAREALRGAR